MTDDPRPTPPSEIEAVNPLEPSPSGEAVPTVPLTPLADGPRCPRCGTANRPGMSFCASCGGRLVAADSATMARPGEVTAYGACPRCGTANRADAAFCGNCGQALRAFTPPAPPAVERPAHALLGPLVLLVGAVGLIVAWLLPFGTAGLSMVERMFGSGGSGIAVWQTLPGGVSPLVSVFALLVALLPVQSALLAGLAVAGFWRAHAGRAQRFAAWLAIGWCVAFVVGFVLVEVVGGFGNGLLGLLRGMSPAGLIGFLAALIGVVGCATRLADS